MSNSGPLESSRYSVAAFKAMIFDLGYIVFKDTFWDIQYKLVVLTQRLRKTGNQGKQ